MAISNFMREALNALKTARQDKEGEAIVALKKINEMLKTAAESPYDLQITIKGGRATKKLAA
jgi:hypothetical protein